MTNKEMIIELQYAIDLIKQNGQDWLDERDIPILEAAISALEKQIQKKPTGEHYAHMRCPSCGHRIPSGMGSSSRRRDNWCNYCGQAILWE